MASKTRAIERIKNHCVSELRIIVGQSCSAQVITFHSISIVPNGHPETTQVSGGKSEMRVLGARLTDRRIGVPTQSQGGGVQIPLERSRDCQRTLRYAPFARLPRDPQVPFL